MNGSGLFVSWSFLKIKSADNQTKVSNNITSLSTKFA
jgi:hypothetical protein